MDPNNMFSVSPDRTRVAGGEPESEEEEEVQGWAKHMDQVTGAYGGGRVSSHKYGAMGEAQDLLREFGLCL